MSVDGGRQSKEKYGSNERLGEHLDKQTIENGMMGPAE